MAFNWLWGGPASTPSQYGVVLRPMSFYVDELYAVAEDAALKPRNTQSYPPPDPPSYCYWVPADADKNFTIEEVRNLPDHLRELLSIRSADITITMQDRRVVSEKDLPGDLVPGLIRIGRRRLMWRPSVQYLYLLIPLALIAIGVVSLRLASITVELGLLLVLVFGAAIFMTVFAIKAIRRAPARPLPGHKILVGTRTKAQERAHNARIAIIAALIGAVPSFIAGLLAAGPSPTP